MTKGAWVVVIVFWIVVLPLMVWAAIKVQPYLFEFVHWLAVQFDAWRGVN